MTLEKLQQEQAEKRSELKGLKDEARSLSNAEDKVADFNSKMDEVRSLKDDIDERQQKIDNLMMLEERDDDSEDKIEENDAKGKQNHEQKNEGADKKMKVDGKGNKADSTRDAGVKIEQRDALNTYLHTRGQKLPDEVRGVDSGIVGAIVPKEIIYNPQAQVNTVVDLSTLVTKTPVTMASGTYPILERADDVLHTTKELEENPALANPKFTNIDWKIETRRGALPVSQEALDDTQVDLSVLLAQQIQQMKVNTTNASIVEIMKSFPAEKITKSDYLPDALKTLRNVKFDPAYSLSLVVTQSLYDALDHLKDGEGRYLLTDQNNTLTSPSGKLLFGTLPVTVVKDTQFGKDGDMVAFMGDLGKAILFADRQDVMIQWVDNPTYGRILNGVLRYDVEKADEQAGKFITVDAGSTTQA